MNGSMCQCLQNISPKHVCLCPDLILNFSLYTLTLTHFNPLFHSKHHTSHWWFSTDMKRHKIYFICIYSSNSQGAKLCVFLWKVSFLIFLAEAVWSISRNQRCSFFGQSKHKSRWLFQVCLIFIKQTKI